MDLIRRLARFPALLLILWPLAALAQDEDDGGRGSLGTLRVIDPESRKFQQLLRQTRDAIEEERFDDALRSLGQLLTGDPEKSTESHPVMAEDFFLVNRSGGAFTSIKTEALRLLDSIPAKALKQYELAHGAEAQALLDEAYVEGDADKLAEVMRRFFHTEAGYRACLALGRLHLEQGRPRSAASYLKRLTATPAAHKATEPEASVLLAAALRHAGQVERAKETLLALKQRQPTFAIRGAESPAFASDDEALDWLAKIFGRPQGGEQPTALQWTMFRGSAERNAIASFAEPTSAPRWRVPVANDPNDEQLIAEAARAYQQQGIPSLPSIHPLAVRNVVIMRGPDRLVAIDVQSGKRIWEPAPKSEAKKELRNAMPNAVSVRASQLKQQVWDDAPLGQLSSDGELVFYVEGLGDAIAYSGNPTYIIDRSRRDKNPDAQPPTNMVVALSLKKQGSLVWMTPPTSKDHPLHDALFLGSPLPVNGQLYVIAEIKGEISLVALEASTGEFKWKQQIGHVENFGAMSDPLRRLAGASPSYADGVLVCPTTAGAVVAIDVATRRLLWGTEYQRTETRFARYEAYSRYARYGERWMDATATIVDGKVILTPPDSAELHCLDLTTGKPVWAAQKRDDLLFVAGVHDGTIVLVGKSQIAGINLADGRRAWEDVAIDLPSGRGVLDRSHYYQPTAAGKLLVVDVASGKIEHTFSTAEPLGNLVTYRDDIISLTDRQLAAYPRIDRLEQKIAEALARNAKDPWALARRGELLMHERKWTDALATLRDAFSQPKPDPAVRSLLVQTILALLEEDYSKHQSLAAEVENLLDDPALRDRYHRIVALGREKAGDGIGAFREFLAIEASGAKDEFSAAGEKLVNLDLHWQARGDRWIAARLANLYRNAAAPRREEMDQAVAARFRSVPANSPAALRSFAERFAFHPLASEAQLELARVLVTSNNLLDAEALVGELTTFSDRRVAARATAAAANIFRLSNHWPEAIRRYERLATDFADVEIEPGQTGKQLHESVAKQFEYRQQLALVNKAFARGRAVVEPDTRNSIRNVGETRKSYPLAFLQADTGGELPPTAVLDPTPGQSMLRVRDGAGHDVTLVNLNRADNRRFFSNIGGLATARLSGHLLVMSTGNEILAIDLLRSGRDPSEVIVWRHDLADLGEPGGYTMMQTRGIANPWTTNRFMAVDANNRPLGIVSPITAAGVCFIKQKQLLCVNATSGETQWQRSDAEPGCDLFGDEEYLFVSAHNSDQAEVFHMLDGSPAGKRKVANYEHRWATNGRRVLSWSQTGKGMKLQLDDVWAEKNVWTETAPSGSRAWLCSPDEVAILSLDGSLKIRSLQNNTIKLTAQIDKEKDLQQLYVLKSSTQYVVAVAVPPTNPITNVNLQPAPGGNHSPLFTGKVYAFDAASGKPSWPAPAAVSQMGLPLDQPLDQPVLLFLRNVIPRNGQGAQKLFTGVLALDKRTGAVLMEDHEIPNSTASYDLEAERDASAVRLAVPGKAVRIRFTEDPAPPEPPAQNDSAFAVRSGTRGSTFGGIIRAFQPRVEEPIIEFPDP